MMHRSHICAALALIPALCIFAPAASPAREGFDLATAYRIIASKTLVDLTHSFGPDTPV
jgi:hypothetical protein